MDVKFSLKDKHLIITMTGDIDHHTASTLKDRIDREFMMSNARHMIFDFSKVSFMDSAGVGMVIGRYKNLSQSGGRVSVAGLNGDINRIFDISGLFKIVEAYKTVEEGITHGLV